MQQSNILEVSHLTIVFRSVVALEDVSLQVRTGEILALLGADGAGKTTVMKILGGLYPAKSYQGEIALAGEPAIFNTPRDAIRRGISVVPRRPGVFGSLSVGENIAMGNWETSGGFLIKQQAIHDQAQETLKWLGVTLDLSVPAEQLDPAQKRVVALARAVNTQPRLVVLDEPAAYVSGPAAMGQLMRIVRLFAARGITTLYLTRTPAEAIQIADRITVLRDGITEGTFERADFDPTVLTMQMMSQQPGRPAGMDDDADAPGGLMGSLKSIFSFSSRK
jgi:ABC-type sugar transport system ATPase subunit